MMKERLDLFLFTSLEIEEIEGIRRKIKKKWVMVKGSIEGMLFY